MHGRRLESELFHQYDGAQEFRTLEACFCHVYKHVGLMACTPGLLGAVLVDSR